MIFRMESLYEMMTLLLVARALVGLRQQELADRAGISRQILVRIENSEVGVQVAAVEKVRKALQKEGVEFLPSTSDRGPGIAMKKRKVQGGADTN